MMNNDEHTDDFPVRLVREADPPPAVPREEMWARIQATRSAARVIPIERRRIPRPRLAPWLGWSGAIAATLVIGIGLGRVSVTAPNQPSTDVALTDATAPSDGDVPVAYRVAASQHMQRTEVLLASLAVTDRANASELSAWARDLLTDTRLLLGSPLAEDAAAHALLEDLELILAQIATMPAARANEEVELIQNGLNQSDVLLRLRAATAGPTLAGT